MVALTGAPQTFYVMAELKLFRSHKFQEALHVGDKYDPRTKRKQDVGPHNHHQSTRQWPHVIGQVMEKLMGANVSTAINFDNLEVDVPWAQGPGCRDLGGA